MGHTGARRADALGARFALVGGLALGSWLVMLCLAGCGSGGGRASLQQRSVTAAAPLLTLRSGEPFFPIGIYSVSSPALYGYDPDMELDDVLAELKAAGFNTAQTYWTGVGYLESFLDACESHGLNGLVRPGPAGDAAAFADGAHLAHVPALRSAPALLAWYLFDEPDLLGIPADVLAQGRDDIGELDSQSGIAIVVSDPDYYDTYAEATDMLMTDTYPIHVAGSWPLESVGDAVRQAIDATANAKPVWAVIQAFGFQNEVNDGWHYWLEPTPEELRAMTYLAIVQGASGVFFYSYCSRGYYIEDSPEFWQAVKDVAGEINSLLPCLVRPPAAPVTMALSRATRQISCTTRTDGQNSCLIAVNAEPEPVSAQFRLPGQPATAEVLFEGRSVDVQAGILSDHFDGYAVHVYRY